jgi:Na+/melibiose symporter-like transporter
MFVLTLAHFAVLAMRGGTLFYYFQYYADKSRLFDLLQGLGLTGSGNGGLWRYLLNTFGLIVDPAHSNVASVGFSLFQISSQFVQLCGVAAAAFLSVRYGKKAVVTIGFSLTAVLMAAFLFLPPDAVGTMFVLEYARVLAYGTTIPLVWAMFADVVDFAEWKTGRRATGIVYATILFALKAGLSLGGAIAGWLLSGYGYQANVAQSAHALDGIRLTISLYPSLLLLVAVGCLGAYRITKQLNLQIQDELALRRSKFAAG